MEYYFVGTDLFLYHYRIKLMRGDDVRVNISQSLMTRLAQREAWTALDILRDNAIDASDKINLIADYYLPDDEETASAIKRLLSASDGDLVGHPSDSVITELIAIYNRPLTAALDIMTSDIPTADKLDKVLCDLKGMQLRHVHREFAFAATERVAQDMEDYGEIIRGAISDKRRFICTEVDDYEEPYIAYSDALGEAANNMLPWYNKHALFERSTDDKSHLHVDVTINAAMYVAWRNTRDAMGAKQWDELWSAYHNCDYANGKAKAAAIEASEAAEAAAKAAVGESRWQKWYDAERAVQAELLTDILRAAIDPDAMLRSMLDAADEGSRVQFAIKCAARAFEIDGIDFDIDDKGLYFDHKIMDVSKERLDFNVFEALYATQLLSPDYRTDKPDADKYVMLHTIRRRAYAIKAYRALCAVWAGNYVIDDIIAGVHNTVQCAVSARYAVFDAKYQRDPNYGLDFEAVAVEEYHRLCNQLTALTTR